MPLDQRQIKAAFNKAAHSYDDFAHLQREIADSLLTRLSWIPCAPDSIVDVGCGRGYASAKLRENFPAAQVIALDLAQNMLSQVANAVCANAAALPLANQSVDIIFSNLMLQWCDDFQRVFIEFARVLKPDGILLFTTFGPDTLKELRAAWDAADGCTAHVNPFVDMHEIGDVLLGSGFVNPVMDVERLTRYYPDSMALMRELKAIGAHNVNQSRVHTLTGKQRMQRMQAAYEHYRHDKGLPASYEVVYGFARGGGAFEFAAYSAA
jgi:malonyl-CoA O-methyltransferase